MKEFGINYQNFIFTYKEYDNMDSERLKWHIHPFYELLYIVDGKINYIVENKQYTLEKGDLLVIPSACYHTLHTIIEGPYKRFCINFLNDFTDKALIDEVFDNYKYLKLSEIPATERVMQLLMDMFLDMSPESSKEKQVSLCETMLKSLLIYISSKDRQEQTVKTQIISKKCQDILDFINVNLTQIHSLEQIANHFFCSKTYINHLFKKEMNIGVMSFIRNKKILLAQKLLKEGKKPSDIFYECGFNNYISFYRAYCQYLGVPPSINTVKKGR